MSNTKPIKAISSSEKLIHELTVAADASIGVVAIRCAETEVFRVVDDLYTLAMNIDTGFKLHTAETGWCDYHRIDPDDTKAPPFDPLDPSTNDKTSAAIEGAFQYLWGDNATAGFFIMLDLYFNFADMVVQTRIRKQVQRSLSTDQQLFLIVPLSAEIPDALAPLMHVIEFGYPNKEELSQSLDDVLENLKPEDRPGSDEETHKDKGTKVTISILTEEERNSIISNGQGMTSNGFETAVALSITEYGAEHGAMDGFDADYITKIIRQYKTELLRKTNVLELQKPVPEEDIGGLDLFKAWMHQRKETFTKEAKELMITPSRGCLVIGPPGCVSGSTTISVRRGRRHSSRPMRLDVLYRKFNGEHEPKSRPWDLNLPTYVHSWDADTGTVFYNKIKGVYYSGKKRVICIRAGADYIKITPDDRLLMGDGTFKSVSDIRVGDKILIKGSMKPMKQGGRNVNRPRSTVSGLKYYEAGNLVIERGEAGDYHYRTQRRARLVVEAHMNGLSYSEYIHHLKNVPDHPYRSVLSSAFDVHHLDEDTMNDKLVNLQVLLRHDHLALHREQHMENLNVEYTTETTVTAVDELDEVKTYALQMESPCENFVCENSFIAHNTGKSLVAKAAGSILSLPVIRFDVGRVFGSYIGQSEQAMRAVLAMLDAMAPCVLMLDEIDKGFSGMSGGGGGNDSGTTARVFGTFLTWMQERDQLNRPVFLIMTANRIDGLPPELLRKGRVDEIFAVGVPNAVEREQILKIHLRLRNQKLDKAEMKAVVRITDTLVGAEIEALVEDSLVISLSSKKAGVTYEFVEEANKHLKPMSLTRAGEFKAMQAWAVDNARAASSTTGDAAPAKPNKPRGLRRPKSRMS